MTQAPTMVLPKTWPLVTQPDNRSSSPTKDARLVNCYAEKDPDNGWQVQKRFGLGPPEFTLPAGQGYGLYRYSFIGASVASVTHYLLMAVQVSAGLANLYFIGPPLTTVPTIMGQVLVGSSISKIQYASVPGFDNNDGAMFLTNGTQPYWFTGPPSPNSLVAIKTQIQGGNYPNATVPGVVYLDGTVYVMDYAGNIYGSGLQAPAAWDPLNVIQANAEPDGAVALAKQLVYVVAIKEWTTQFFYDAGNAVGSPLAPVPGALLPYGCLSADTLAKIDGILIWATSNETNSAQIIIVENLAHKIVSTPSIERQLDLANPSSAFHSFAIKHGGHRLYFLTNVTTNITLVYDIDQKLWYQWMDFQGNYFPLTSQAIDLDGDHIMQHVNNGIIYPVDLDLVYPTDNGTVFPVDIYTPNEDFDTVRDKVLSGLYFIGDKNPGSVLQSRYTDDDYQTYSNFRTVDLSQGKPKIADEGTFWRRAYHFRHQCPTAFRMTAAALQMDLGAS